MNANNHHCHLLSCLCSNSRSLALLAGQSFLRAIRTGRKMYPDPKERRNNNWRSGRGNESSVNGLVASSTTSNASLVVPGFLSWFVPGVRHEFMQRVQKGFELLVKISGYFFRDCLFARQAKDRTASVGMT